jgi:2-amino-4-hydroxy-6-hydroxymethyldihydropteridine diphosphokinase/dihydropteroate synthase
MKCWVGLGSNLGDRRANLEKAAKLLQKKAAKLRSSPLLQNKALIPEGASSEWQLPFLNAVVELEWEKSSEDLLQVLKNIEAEMGRESAPRWAPRLIDLDLLIFGSEIINRADFKVPHAEIWNRDFVLEPLKHLCSSLIPPGKSQSVLSRSRELTHSLPLWMGILNLTPDSFSEDGVLSHPQTINQKIQNFEDIGVHIIDVGAESTRPQAKAITANEEWGRLKPTLEFLRERKANHFFFPWISVDTRHVEVAERALELGADLINDVSGLSDPAMAELLQSSHCQYVLMHSLSVPADSKKVLPADLDPIEAVKAWALQKLEGLSKMGVSLDRILFDPGIGFGKTAQQSLYILQRVEELFELPVRLLVGHSRKSFMTSWTQQKSADRDPESIGVSLQMAKRKVDVLRVHEPEAHIRAYQAFEQVSP